MWLMRAEMLDGGRNDSTHILTPRESLNLTSMKKPYLQIKPATKNA
jgi:hypothetical protein